MGPSDFGQLLKPGRGVQMHQFGAVLVERSLAGDDLAGQLGTLRNRAEATWLSGMMN